MTQPRTARDRIDRVFAIVRRTRRFVVPALLLFFVGGVASLGYAMVRKRVFKSETLILYREGIRSMDIVGGEDQGDRAQKLGLRLKEMVLSRTRLEQIITTAKLYPELVYDRGMIDAVDEMRKHIAFRVQDGDTFGLSFEGPDPERVALVTSKLADALIGENSRTNSEQAEVTKEFLDREKDRIEKELKEKETALAQFLSKHPEFARETAQPGQNQAGASIRAASAANAARAASAPRGDSTLAAREREAGRLEARLGVPVTHKRKEDVQADPGLLANKQEAESDLKQAQKELADKQGEFTEEHPDVRAARARVRQAQEKLKRANDAVVANLSALQLKTSAKEEDEGYIDRGALENQLKRINEEISEYKRRKSENAAPTTVIASSVVALETDWVRLNREVVDVRDRFQSLQDKEFKASMVESAAATGRTAQMVVVDPAFVPKHAAPPGRTTIMAAGLAATMVLAMLLALGLALIDDRIYDRDDIERLAMLPLLGVVPRAGKEEKKVKLG
ncbi:MAG: GumC family protein [Polyangia bacterium]